MKIVWIFSNAVAVVTTLVCMSYLYYACRPIPRAKLPLSSILVIGVTVAISGLQFVYPELLAALRRDPEAIRGGELWRLVTALFVQPNGISQCVANGFLILAFMPAAERLYGRSVLVAYFAAGLAGTTVNYFWDSGSGGSSPAIFGLMGSLLIYIVRNRKALLLPFVFIAGTGLLCSVLMLVSRDGHGVGLVVGALLASILPVADVTFRSKETDTFAEPPTDLDGPAPHRAGA
ncbi:MAG TPA: rhomboid family intramembrane serine protease [Gammaproteobacteria bacterium]|nr:rhomboid family intramembrane serine protease [Gammaproteobacteria bacterium]